MTKFQALRIAIRSIQIVIDDMLDHAVDNEDAKQIHVLAEARDLLEAEAPTPTPEDPAVPDCLLLIGEAQSRKP